MSRIVSIILARGGSKGIPNKNILPINGKPLIAWTIEQSKNSVVSETYVSSDSKKILNTAAKYGASTIKRPDALSTDESSSEDALIHALNVLGDVDLVVFLQPTSPIRYPCDINNAISTLLENGYDSVFSCTELKDYCLWKMNADGKMISTNFDYTNRKRRQDKKIQYLENGSIYVFKPEILIKNKNRLGGNIGISVMEFWKSYEIDTVEDIEICEHYLKQL